MASLTASYSATISQVALDASTGRDWRTSGTVKAYDVDGDNIYGTTGYRIASFDGENNPLNILQPSWATFSVVGGLGGFEGPGSEEYQASFDDVTQTGVGPVPDIIAGDWYRNGGGGPNVQDFFTITLTAPASFRLGVIGDQTTNAVPGLIGESSDAVQVVGPGGADSGLMVSGTKNSIPDYYLFDITGTVGDVFTIKGRNDIGWSDNALGGFFVDQIPEPSVSLLGILGALGLILRRRRR
jgi:hypothetical protein